MNKDLNQTLIKSPARRNKLFSLLAGLVLCCASALFGYWWPEFHLYLVLGYLVGILLIFISLLKYYEPSYSLALTPDKLIYIHRHGQWSIDWQDIVLVTQPSVSYGLERRYIPYLGIKLRDVSGVAASVSPRLANRQIHEQRDILILACQQELITVEQASLNFSPYRLNDTTKITGPIAAWLHQIKVLHSAYGCDLFIPVTSFSQPPEQMISLFKQYQLSAAARS